MDIVKKNIIIDTGITFTRQGMATLRIQLSVADSTKIVDEEMMLYVIVSSAFLGFVMTFLMAPIFVGEIVRV